MHAHDDPTSYPPGWDARRTADVLREAIEATGGPQSESLGAIRVHIDRQCRDFPWADDWSGQIAGAKAGLRSRLRLPAATADASSRAAPPPSRESPWAMARIDAAREFLACIEGRSLERACRALALCDDLGGPAEMHRALELWSELVAAGGGDAETVARVLDVLMKHQLATPPIANVRATIRHAA